MGLFLGSKVVCVCMPSMPPCWRVPVQSGCTAPARLVLGLGRYFGTRWLVGPQRVFLVRPAHGVGRRGGHRGFPGCWHIYARIHLHFMHLCVHLCMGIYMYLYVYVDT